MKINNTDFKPLFFSKPLSSEHKLYLIEQFPKNKDITNLSNEQKFIRLNQKKVIHKETKVCKKCKKELSIEEFYKIRKDSDKRQATCRDCTSKRKGIVEIGKIRFSRKILQKGFHKCYTCKDLLPITEFFKTKNKFDYRCKKCTKEKNQSYLETQKNKALLIKTKFSIGDTVWIMLHNKPKECIINQVIHGRLKKDYSCLIKYIINIHGTNNNLKFYEKYLFKTKEELINSL